MENILKHMETWPNRLAIWLDKTEIIIDGNSLLTIIITVIISVLIALFFYRRSSIVTPKWAKPILRQLPKQKPSSEELLQIFQEHLDTGEFEIDPHLQIVACPECGESAKNFERSGVGDDNVTIVTISCPSCGWSKDVTY